MSCFPVRYNLFKQPSSTQHCITSPLLLPSPLLLLSPSSSHPPLLTLLLSPSSSHPPHRAWRGSTSKCDEKKAKPPHSGLRVTLSLTQHLVSGGGTVLTHICCATVCVRVCACAYVCMSLCVCAYVCASVCMYVCMYVKRRPCFISLLLACVLCVYIVINMYICILVLIFVCILVLLVKKEMMFSTR